MSTDKTKEKTCHHNRAEINITVEQYYLHTGNWPANDLSDIARRSELLSGWPADVPRHGRTPIASTRRRIVSSGTPAAATTVRNASACISYVSPLLAADRGPSRSSRHCSPLTVRWLTAQQCASAMDAAQCAASSGTRPLVRMLTPCRPRWAFDQCPQHVAAGDDADQPAVLHHRHAANAVHDAQVGHAADRIVRHRP